MEKNRKRITDDQFGKSGLRGRCMKRRAAAVMAAAVLLQSWSGGLTAAAHMAAEKTAGVVQQEDMAAFEEEFQTATISDAAAMAAVLSDPWEGWNGDADFPGDGTEEKPYQIRSLAHLMGLSQAVAEGESFEGEYFELTQDINLAL